MLSVGADPDVFATHPELGHELAWEDVTNDGEEVRRIISDYFDDYENVEEEREKYPLPLSKIPRNVREFTM